MSDMQRYVEPLDGFGGLAPSTKGAWVLYEDHCAALAEATRKGEHLCQAHGNALIEMHELQTCFDERGEALITQRNEINDLKCENGELKTALCFIRMKARNIPGVEPFLRRIKVKIIDIVTKAMG